MTETKYPRGTEAGGLISGSKGVNQQQNNVTTKDTSEQTPWATCGNSAEAQRQRLMAHFRVHGSIDTITSRRDLDILHPAGRVMELRKAGESIDTIRVNVVTEAGKVHSVARYVLCIKDGEVQP